MSSNPTPQKTHRKRGSALRLSTDTFPTLPEYLPTGLNRDHSVHSDHPPDYPDSAEEADEDTDTDLSPVEVPQLVFQKLSPKRPKRSVSSHKRRHSSQHQLSDPHLDSLLERSIHALEMSNTLLQFSISTQTSLSTVLALDSPPDCTLEACAHNLSSRIKNSGDVQASWADDLEEISKKVEGLCREDIGHSRRNSVRAVHPEDGAVSCSLPTSSLRTMRKKLRRPSLDLRHGSADAACLHYSPHSRSHLIAPPPRALTQYVASTQDSETILLPSTLGHRSSPSLHHASDWKTLSERASSSSINLLSTPSLPPKLTDKPLEPSTPAYTLLSSFVYRAPSSGSATPSSSFATSFISRRRDSSIGSASTERERERGHGCTRRSSSPASQSVDTLHHHCGTCVSGLPPEPSKRVLLPMVLHRPMTPPAEESSSSSDSCVARRTLQSLRKILDDQAILQPNGQSHGVSSFSIYRSGLRAPPFLPRSPAPVAEAGTSTATASISRLFTKGTHSSSTRPPSPPRQSAMRHSPSSTSSSTSLSAVAPTPPKSTSNTPMTLSFPEVVIKALGGGSSPSSGMSTPTKRISFAELPESYASTRPNGGSSSKFKNKNNRRKRKNGPGSGRGQSSPERTGWWNGWLTSGDSNVHGLTMTLARQERMEERTNRNWGGRMGSGFLSNLDDWAV